MSIISPNSEKSCRFCGDFTNEQEFHEEFDFYRHPSAKDTLRKLYEKTQALKIYDLDEYAIHRKLRTEHGIVIPGYPRLLNAWKWMLKLVETEKITPVFKVSDLPL